MCIYIPRMCPFLLHTDIFGDTHSKCFEGKSSRTFHAATSAACPQERFIRVLCCLLLLALQTPLRKHNAPSPPRYESKTTTDATL